MKKFTYILASLLVLAGCTERLDVTDNTLVPDGEMAVNLTMEAPMAIHTRSYVSGVEEAVSTIKMLCFDNQGAFITSRDATLAPETATKGALTGSVPANTARIHFVANMDFTDSRHDLSAFGAGSLERAMMKAPQLASDITENISFWGYHREANANAMAAYLSGGNKVTLLRDRAKVTVINEDEDITSLKWTISNGLNKGYVAARSSADNSNPYDNTYETKTLITEYRADDAEQYTLEDDQPGAEKSIWAGPGAEDPQFLFELNNLTDNPAKIIVHATYKDGTSRYHTFLLQDANKKLYPVFRNSAFVLTIKDLPSASETTSIGADGFDDAVTTTNYSNNPFAQVDREATEINDDQYNLTVERTSKFYSGAMSATETRTGTITFTYSRHDGDEADWTGGEVKWIPNTDDDMDDVADVTVNPTVSYVFDAEKGVGNGTITFNLAQITSDLKFSTLQIVSPTGLTRYVNIYSIAAFQFAVEPALVDNNTKRTVRDIDRETYKLTFFLPEDLPKELYPLTVKLYTNTLLPFSDNTATAKHGAFDVAVGKTDDLDGTDNPNNWNYLAKEWDSWYEYVIAKPSEDNSYTIYLNELIMDYFPERSINQVGLFFEIEHFAAKTSTGGLVTRAPLYCAAPALPTVTETTFNASEFSRWTGNTSSVTKNGVTVQFANSSRDSDWGTYYIQIGRQGGSGTMTVSGGSGATVAKIEATYYSSDYARGTASPSTGSYSISGSTGTWTGSTNNVVLTMSPYYNYYYHRITSFKVTTYSY